MSRIVCCLRQQKHNKIHSIFVQTDYHAFTIKPGASKHVKCFSWHHGGHASLNCNFSLMILQQIRNIFSSVFTRTLFVYAEATKVGQWDQFNFYFRIFLVLNIPLTPLSTWESCKLLYMEYQFNPRKYYETFKILKRYCRQKIAFLHI